MMSCTFLTVFLDPYSERADEDKIGYDLLVGI
jgi:hypothetical protein